MPVKWVRPSVAARRLGVSGPRVSQMVDQGLLVGEKTVLGRIVEASSVERLAAERERQAEVKAAEREAVSRGSDG